MFAVGHNDVTLYVANGVGALDVVSGTTGQLTGSVALPLPPDGVVVTQDGSMAYVWTKAKNLPAGRFFVVNTATLTMTGAPTAAGYIDDVVLSPDDSLLYVSVDCGEDCNPSNAECPIAKGICAFDRRTLALKWNVPNVNGLMSVSLDGSSLYVATQAISGGGALYVVNTSTHAVSRIPLPGGSAVISRASVDPVSHCAMVLVANRYAHDSQTAFLINTTTNKVLQNFFVAPREMGRCRPRKEQLSLPTGSRSRCC